MSNPAVVKVLLAHSLDNGEVTFKYIRPSDGELRGALYRLPWLTRKDPNAPNLKEPNSAVSTTQAPTPSPVEMMQEYLMPTRPDLFGL